MKYRDINVEFAVAGVNFSVVSLAEEMLEAPMPMHTHSKNSFEIHFIASGEGVLNTGERTYRITPSTLYVTGPGIPHEQISDKGNPMKEYCLYIKADRVAEEAMRQDAFMKPFFDNPFWFGLGDAGFEATIHELFSELMMARTGYELVVKALMEKIVVLLVRRYSEKENILQGSTAKRSINEDLMYLIIEEAFLYNYVDITLEGLAESICLSPRQTERLLKLHYNMNFQQKKKEARMSAAISLLKNTDMKISDIAYETGYSSVEHFSTAMKKYSGLTATKIRKMP